MNNGHIHLNSQNPPKVLILLCLAIIKFSKLLLFPDHVSHLNTVKPEWQLKELLPPDILSLILK